MKSGKLANVLVAFLTLWACICTILLCSSLGMFANWLLARTFSNISFCMSAFCTPNRDIPVSMPVPVLGGTAGFVHNPLVVLLNVMLYLALIRFYSRLRQTRRDRLAESKMSDAQFDKSKIEKEVGIT